MIYDVVKRVGDVVLSALALVVLTPVILLVALLVRWRLGAPVLFRQERPGQHGRPFEILKFRTMLPEDEARGVVEDEARLTRFGTLLRAASLDELPELWNVLRGDMSLVGPRPLRVEYLARYTERQARRHEMRPGLTGLAQVSGRNDIGWDDRLGLDVQYVDSRSPLTDARILLRTAGVVLRQDGVDEEGHATSSIFPGPRRTEDLELRAVRPGDLLGRAEWVTDAPATTDRRHDFVAIDRRSGDVRALCGLTEMSGRIARAHLGVEPRLRGTDLERQVIELLKTESRAQGLTCLVVTDDPTAPAVRHPLGEVV